MRRPLIVVAALGSALLLVAVFGFQWLGYAPCKMCIWQRWPHGVAVVLGVIGALVPVALIAWAGAVSMAVTAGIGVYHTGVERGWWEGPTSCTGSGGGLGSMSGADLLSTSGVNDIVMCDQVAWSFLGLSMASWNVIASVVLMLIWVAAARHRRLR